MNVLRNKNFKRNLSIDQAFFERANEEKRIHFKQLNFEAVTLNACCAGIETTEKSDITEKINYEEVINTLNNNHYPNNQINSNYRKVIFLSKKEGSNKSDRYNKLNSEKNLRSYKQSINSIIQVNLSDSVNINSNITQAADKVFPRKRSNINIFKNREKYISSSTLVLPKLKLNNGHRLKESCSSNNSPYNSARNSPINKKSFKSPLFIISNNNLQKFFHTKYQEKEEKEKNDKDYIKIKVEEGDGEDKLQKIQNSKENLQNSSENLSNLTNPSFNINLEINTILHITLFNQMNLLITQNLSESISQTLLDKIQILQLGNLKFNNWGLSTKLSNEIKREFIFYCYLSDQILNIPNIALFIQSSLNLDNLFDQTKYEKDLNLFLYSEMSICLKEMLNIIDKVFKSNDIINHFIKNKLKSLTDTSPIPFCINKFVFKNILFSQQIYSKKKFIIDLIINCLSIGNIIEFEHYLEYLYFFKFTDNIQFTKKFMFIKKLINLTNIFKLINISDLIELQVVLCIDFNFFKILKNYQISEICQLSKDKLNKILQVYNNLLNYIHN